MRTPASLPNTIADAIGSIARRRRLQAVARGLAWTCLGAALLVLLAPLAGALDEPPLWLVWTSWAWLLAWLAVPVAFLVVPPWRRTGDPLQVARAIDDRVPETRDSLMTAVDLARALDAGGLTGDPITRHLAHDHIHAASERSSSVRPAELLPWSALGASTLVGPLAAVAALALALLAPGPVGAGLEALLVPAGESRAHEDSVAGADDLPVTLVLRNLVVTLTPPAYAGREPLVLEGTSGDFRALPGTAVTLQADLPGGGGRAVVAWSSDRSPAAEWEAAVEEDSLEATFVVPGEGGYRVLLDRGVLRESLRSRLFQVEVLPDGPPDLEVVGPAGDVELQPADEVALTVRASDDFALSRLELTVVKGGRVVARTPIADVTGLARHEDVVHWSPLELGEGGELELVVEAWDNDTVSGPKVTRSRPVDVYVPTAEDHHKQVLEAKRRLLDQALDLLAELLVANHRAGDSQRREQLVTDFDHQDRLAKGFFDTARSLADGMEQDRYEHLKVYVGIGQLTENLARRWEQVREVVETRVRYAEGAVVPTSTVSALVDARRDAVRELEQIALDLASFIDLQVGDRVAAEMAELDADMADMAELLRQAEDGKQVDEALARALDELQRQLLELSEQLGERSRGPQDSYANQLPQDLGQDLMSELQEMIEQGRHAEAMERLQEAMEALAQMREQLQQESEEMAGGQMAEQLQQQMEDAVARAQELERQQQAVIDSTEQLEQSVGSDDGADSQAMDEIRQDMDRLAEMIGSLPPESMDPTARGAVRQWARPAGRSAERMRASFEGGDREAAIEYGAEASAYLDETGEAAREMAARGFQAGSREARDKARKAGRLADDIVSRMAQAEERSRRAQSRAARGSEPIQGQQAGVREGVSELSGQMESMGGSAYNPAAGRANLEAAGQMMERAQGRLAQGRTGPALQSERDALQQLQAFRESLQQSQQAMQTQGQRMGQKPGMAGSRPWQRLDRHDGWEDRGDVEMPDPDDFVSPEAFRALVQEEARGDAPERYRPLTGSYYEEIVR
jgi:hypothetical protein